MTESPRIIRRTIGLATSADDWMIEQVRTTPGVADLRLLPDRRSIEVSYEPDRMDFDAVAALLSAAGLRPTNSLLARLRRHWIAFQEQNERAQSKVVHHCCGQPPADT